MVGAQHGGEPKGRTGEVVDLGMSGKKGVEHGKCISLKQACNHRD